MRLDVLSRNKSENTQCVYISGDYQCCMLAYMPMYIYGTILCGMTVTRYEIAVSHIVETKILLIMN